MNAGRKSWTLAEAYEQWPQAVNAGRKPVNAGCKSWMLAEAASPKRWQRTVNAGRKSWTLAEACERWTQAWEHWLRVLDARRGL